HSVAAKLSALSVLRCRLAAGRPPALCSARLLPPAGRTVWRGPTAHSRALVVLDDLRQLPQSPRPALLLGAAGLLPFAAAPVLMLRTGHFSAELLHAQLAYGACILSFLGGVRWGVTLPDGAPQRPDWANLTRSVTPSLVAWAGLLAPPSAGGLMLIGGLGLAGYWDMVMYGYPAWFKALRFCLSVGAILSLWTALMCKWFLVDQEKAAAKPEGDSASQ
ncbi:transmembrane protein 69-like, partial [Amphibalanus amphitrite]|uniref:transmembrane protein 69-like n=1 Tax=Amphibalanus amphitrite TaxID=1232801 RepID=UPI001C91024C